MSEPAISTNISNAFLSAEAWTNRTLPFLDCQGSREAPTLTTNVPKTESIIVTAVFTGLLTQVVIFRRGEWDKHAHKIFWFHLAALITIFSTILKAFRKSGLSSAQAYAARVVGVGFTSYAVAVFAGIVFYRVFLHRLKNFPGPVGSSISNWHTALLSIQRWRIHEELQTLHKQHGDYVRTGPTELSVTNPDAIQDIYGVQSLCVRGPICNLSPVRYLYAFDRNKIMHDSQRRIWYRAFGAKAVQQYDHITARHTERLREFLLAREGSPVLLNEVFRLLSFDVMVEAFYGKQAGSLDQKKEVKVQRLVHRLKLELAIVVRLPWIVSLGRIWPWSNGAYPQTCQESDKLVNSVLNEKSSSTFHQQPQQEPGFYTRAFDYFLDFYHRERDRRKADRVIRGDSDLFLIAGWDNQANMMATTMFLLVQHPEILSLVREELKSKRAEFRSSLQTFGQSSKIDPDIRWANMLTSSPHLISVIHETMRLFPSLAQGVQRMTPPQGLQLGDTFIPGDVIVAMPHYSLFRDARSFIDPDSFRPERWTTRPDLVKNSKVFVPFGTGQSPCPGRHLATRMMRHIIAELVLSYDFEFAPDTTPQKVLDETFEAFNMVFGPVNLVFRPHEVDPEP